MYADGYLPRELDFMVVEQHPTLLNVTLQITKVGGSLYRDSPPSASPLEPKPDAGGLGDTGGSRVASGLSGLNESGDGASGDGGGGGVGGDSEHKILRQTGPYTFYNPNNPNQSDSPIVFSSDFHDKNIHIRVATDTIDDWRRSIRSEANQFEITFPSTSILILASLAWC